MHYSTSHSNQRRLAAGDALLVLLEPLHCGRRPHGASGGPAEGEGARLYPRALLQAVPPVANRLLGSLR
eukprot:scaffold76166_cov69-Phaeocystis_antarctica.AAC.4